MNKNQLITTRKVTILGVMAALSVVLAFLIHIPFPPAPFLEYDPADIPILFVSFLFGPLWGIVLTLIVSILQGITVSAGSGIYGILMHFFATSTFVIASGLFYRYKKTLMGAIIALVIGTVAQTFVMIPLNLIFTPMFLGTPVQAVIEMLIPVIIPFNAMKAGINAVVTGLIYCNLKNFASKYLEI